MKKALLYVCLLLLLIFGVMVYNFVNRTATPEGGSATSASAPWEPTRLRIPVLHIDASVLSVGATASGVMDAPTSGAIHSSNRTSVFWYSPGVAPGQAGNAVIASHVDRVGGDPAIFWSLNNLALGERISVLTLQETPLQFVVTRVVTYPANAPSQDVINAVFGPTQEHHLNLITCSGVWTGNGYDTRLVIFTTQVS